MLSIKLLSYVLCHHFQLLDISVQCLSGRGDKDDEQIFQLLDSGNNTRPHMLHELDLVYKVIFDQIRIIGVI